MRHERVFARSARINCIQLRRRVPVAALWAGTTVRGRSFRMNIQREHNYPPKKWNKEPLSHTTCEFIHAGTVTPAEYPCGRFLAAHAAVAEQRLAEPRGDVGRVRLGVGAAFIPPPPSTRCMENTHGSVRIGRRDGGGIVQKNNAATVRKNVQKASQKTGCPDAAHGSAALTPAPRQPAVSPPR